jgi:hypothetical protein
MLRSRTGAQVIFDFPDDTAPGIYVWPWRLEEKSEMRNMPPRVQPGRARATEAPAAMVHFLVLVRPALTLDGLSQLETARQAMFDHPILEVAEKRFRIIFLLRWIPKLYLPCSQP